MIEVFASQQAAAEAAAAAIVGRLGEGLRLRGRSSFVATGGRSPGPVYDLLADSGLDWSRVVVTLSDERFAPPDDPQSNAGQLRRRLFVGGAARATFLPLWSEAPTPDAAAAAAEPAIRALAPFDMVLLGMGEDGHIASLIPGSPVLAAGMDLESGRVLLGVPAGVGAPPLARITLTLPALLQSREILITVAGEAKRGVLEDAERGADYPVAALLSQARVPVRILWHP
jgi:6-phosphogluconolactonase